MKFILLVKIQYQYIR